MELSRSVYCVEYTGKVNVLFAVYNYYKLLQQKIGSWDYILIHDRSKDSTVIKSMYEFWGVVNECQNSVVLKWLHL